MVRTYIVSALIACCFLTGAMPILEVSGAYAQAAAPAADPQSGVLDIGAAFGAWKPYINTVGGLVLTGLSGWLMTTASSYIQKKSGLTMDAGMRSTLQTAAANAAGLAIMSLGPKIGSMKITTGHPEIASAANYVLQHAPDAVAHFGITPDSVKQMVIAKIPQVLATNTGAITTGDDATVGAGTKAAPA